MQRAYSEFQRNGIEVFAISYDPVDVLAAFATEHGIGYPRLSDEGSRVIRALGLLNERVYEQHAAFGIPRQAHHWGTPYPGSFVLDESGRVTEKRFDQIYRERETGAGALGDAFGVDVGVHGAESQRCRRRSLSG
ncbi:MAG: redoxin domain-containing protein [Chloroflexota bacterium]